MFCLPFDLYSTLITNQLDNFLENTVAIEIVVIVISSQATSAAGRPLLFYFLDAVCSCIKLVLFSRWKLSG